jgi:hypothetical protein
MDNTAGTNAPIGRALENKVAPKIGGIRAASVICLLAGIWLFVSPWVYGAYTSGNAWNSWIV